MGFDIDFELDSDGLRDFFTHVDPADAVEYIGDKALLDEMGQAKAEDHFGLVHKDALEEMEKRAETAEAALKEPIQKPETNHDYIDFE